MKRNMLHSASAELVFVAQAAGPDRSPRRADAGIDWDTVLELTEKHRVVSRVWRNAAASFPPACAERMRSRAKQRARAALHNVQQTLTAIALLDGAGVPAIVLKGPLLAQRLYGDMGMRECSDVDLMVRRADIMAATRALSGAGYLHDTQLSPDNIRAHLRFEHDISFTDPVDGHLVELHAMVAQPHYSYTIDMDEWWGEAEVMPAGTRRARVLKLEHAYLLSVLHAAKHRWHRLDMISDLAAFECMPLDWNQIDAEARSAGMLRVVEISRALTGYFYHGRPLTGHPLAAALASKVIATQEFGRWNGAWLDLRVRERAADRVRYMVRRTMGSATKNFTGNSARVKLPR